MLVGEEGMICLSVYKRMRGAHLRGGKMYFGCYGKVGGTCVCVCVCVCV